MARTWRHPGSSIRSVPTDQTVVIGRSVAVGDRPTTVQPQSRPLPAPQQSATVTGGRLALRTAAAELTQAPTVPGSDNQSPAAVLWSPCDRSRAPAAPIETRGRLDWYPAVGAATIRAQPAAERTAEHPAAWRCALDIAPRGRCFSIIAMYTRTRILVICMYIYSIQYSRS